VRYTRDAHKQAGDTCPAKEDVIEAMRAEKKKKGPREGHQATGKIDKLGNSRKKIQDGAPPMLPHDEEGGKDWLGNF